MFHRHVFSPGGYGKVELIHSTCVPCVCVGVSRDSGGSSVQHVLGKFCHHLCEEWRREGGEGREGKSGDRWRDIRGGRAIKRVREGKRDAGRG